MRCRNDGLSLIEILLASFILCVLVTASMECVLSAVSNVRVDRAQELARQLVSDLLERCTGDSSTLRDLFKTGSSPNESIELDLDQTFDVVALSPSERAPVRAGLRGGGICGFELVWNRDVSGRPTEGIRTSRLDLLWCRARGTGGRLGMLESFRMLVVDEI